MNNTQCKCIAEDAPCKHGKRLVTSEKQYTTIRRIYAYYGFISLLLTPFFVYYVHTMKTEQKQQFEAFKSITQSYNREKLTLHRKIQLCCIDFNMCGND